MMRWWYARPLRVQLVVVVVVLAAIALLLSGLLATTALRGYLVSQVDQQLMGANAFGRPPDHDQPGPGGGGLPSEFYAQVNGPTGSAVTVLEVPSTGGRPELPAMTTQQALSQGSEPFTVSGTNGSTWRASVHTTPDGDVVSVARSLTDVSATVQRLVFLLLGIGIAVLAVLSVVAALVVRRSLRPLREVEHTATAIAAGDFSQRVAESPSGTEVGQLSTAVNTMLDAIETNISQRDAALAESRASEARMRQFVADASHELRTPLTSVRGYSELYRQGGIPDESVGRTFGRIESEAKRMGVLVDDLLLLARLDQQRPLEHKPVDLLAVVTDVTSSARAAHPGRTVKLNVAGDAVPVVQGDASRLRQVVANLVSNGLKYSGPEGQVAITLQTTQDGWVNVLVDDDGPGIPDADKPRIFERFFRAQASRSRAEGGTGLGLSIVAAIVHAHHGQVAVADSPLGGARFRVTLSQAAATTV